MDFIRRVIGAVRRRSRLVTVVSVCVAALIMLTVLSLGSRYSATTLLVVDKRDARLLGLSGASDEGATLSVDSEVEIMKSANIAQRVAVRLDLAKDPKFAPNQDSSGNLLSRAVQLATNGVKEVGDSIKARISSSGQPNSADIDSANRASAANEERANALAAQALQKITAIRRRGLTNVIAVDVTTDNPREAAQLANMFAQTYIEEQIKTKLRSVERAETALSRRVDEIGEALRRSEAQIETFALSQLTQLSDEAARRDADRLRTSIATASRDAGSQLARLRELEQLLHSQNYASLGQALGAQEIVLLDEQRRSIERQLQSSEGSTTDFRQRLDLLNRQLQAISNQRVEIVRRQSDASNERLTSLRGELEQLAQNANLPANISVQLFRLQQERTATRQLYQDYLGRLKAIAQERSIVTPDAYVVAEASAPPNPSFPPRALLIVLGGLAALAIGAGAGYVRDNYPRNLKTVEELEAASGVPNVGAIPPAKRARKHRRGGPENEIRDNPMSNYSESIRRLRVSLDLVLNQGAGFKSLLVTSTYADEGKTTIALSLARTAAEAGLKVVLLECDLRRPSLHRRLGLSHHPGLAQMLLSPGSASEINVIEPDPRSACSIITSGAVADIAPDRLFQSARFSDLLRSLEADYDLVILDSPPVGAAADPLIIAQNVDAVLLVARSGCATPHDVQVALDELTRAKGRNLVTALNFATTLSGDSYGYMTKVSKR